MLREDQLRAEGDINTGAERRRWWDQEVGAAGRQLIEDDQEVFLHQTLSTPCLTGLTRCEGAYLVDADGRHIMDFHGNNAHQVGFAHPHVVSAVHRQLDALSFCTRRFTNQPSVDLAHKLLALGPRHLTRVLFAPGGSTAVGIALKLARLVTGRFKTISLWDSFHGASLDALSVGGEAVMRGGLGPLLPGAIHVPPCDPSGCPFACGSNCSLRCADFLEYTVDKEGEIGALILETVRNTDMRVAPIAYYERVQSLCREHGIILIVDETAIALGRTGSMYAFQQFGLEPDLVVVGKALGGAVMPLAAVLATEAFNSVAEHSVGHYTHEKNPIAAAAGLATLEVYEQDHLADRARELGIVFGEMLATLARAHSLICDVRGLGLIWSVELADDGTLDVPLHTYLDRVMYEALAAGLSFKVAKGRVITLGPPLTITLAQLQDAVAILDAALSRARSAERSDLRAQEGRAVGPR